MIDNTGLLNDLICAGKIRIKTDNLESLAKLARPFRDLPGIGRIRGMFLGVAVGDALGAPTESMLPEERDRRSFEAIKFPDDRSLGFSREPLITDDTQMTMLALSSILEQRGVVPEKIMRSFAETEIRGAGKTVREAFYRYKKYGQWDTCGVQSAGNGALMRITPYIIPHLVIGGMPLISDILIGTMITHNDSAACAASVGFALMLRELLYFKSPPPDSWWSERFVQIASLLETDERYQSRVSSFIEKNNTLSAWIEQLLSNKPHKEMTTVEACNYWRSGAYLLETVPSVLFILGRYADNPKSAVIGAVQDTRDNDTIASIVGAAMGALHGVKGFPTDWIRHITRSHYSDMPIDAGSLINKLDPFLKEVKLEKLNWFVELSVYHTGYVGFLSIILSMKRFNGIQEEARIDAKAKIFYSEGERIQCYWSFNWLKPAGLYIYEKNGREWFNGNINDEEVLLEYTYKKQSSHLLEKDN